MNTQRFRRALGILIVLVSLTILIWGLWPAGHESLTVPVGPHNLQLPTPTSFLALWTVL